MVRPELVRLLKQAQGEFDLARQPGAELHSLEPCRALLAQADGILRLIELGDAAALAREIGAALADPWPLPAAETDAARHGFFVLLRYLDYLGARRVAVPELLVEDINALRLARRQPLLAECTFAALPEAQPTRVAPPSLTVHADLLRRLRHLYQVGFLGFIKGRGDQVHLRLMQRAAERTLTLCGESDAGFWWLLCAVLEGFSSGELHPGIARNRLLSQFEKRLRELLRHPENASGGDLDAQGRRELLFLVAKCRGGRHVQALRERFALPLLGSDTDTLAERELLMGPSTDSIDSLARAIEPDMRLLREQLEQGAAAGSMAGDALGPVRDALLRVAGALEAGGLRSSADALQEPARRAAAALAAGAPMDRHELLGIADALVYTEATLAGLARDRGLARGMRDEQQGAAAGGVMRSALDEARIAALQAARGCIDAAKQCVSAFADADYDASQLAAVESAMLAVRGVLRILERESAAAIAARVGVVAREAAEGGAPRRELLAEALADALICLEYFLAALENGEEPEAVMMRIAEESLVTLGNR